MVDEKKPPVVVRMPSVGESVTEVVVMRFLKRPGEPVKRDEPVVELETDKATIELTASEPGVIASISAEGQVIKIGEPLYALHVDDDGRSPAVAVAEQGPGLRGWQQAWEVGPTQKRARQLAVLQAERTQAEAVLFATALVRALAAVPALLSRVGQGRPTEVTIEHCEVAGGEAQWSHLSLRADATIHAALAGRRAGRGVGARVRVIRLGSPVMIAASPSPPTDGMTIVIGPAIAEGGQPRATLTIALAQELAAEQVQAFAEALAEQLRAV